MGTSSEDSAAPGLLGSRGHHGRTSAPLTSRFLTYFRGKEQNFQPDCCMKLHFPLEMGPSDLNS